MAVPEQVRKQTEAVQQLYNDLNGEDTSPSPQGEGAPKVVVDNVNPAGNVNDDAPKTVATEPVTEAQEDPNSETFEQRWRTAQGMYNAEVPRLTTTNAELTSRVQQLEGLVTSMRTPEPIAEAVAAAPKTNLTEAEVEEYGESIDIMRKVSEEVAGPYREQIANLTQTINQLRGVVPRVEQIAATQANSNEQSFWSDLTAVVPAWQDINNNPDFQSWLLDIDDLTGQTRQVFLDDAQRNLDVGRVAKFFNQWAKNNGITTAQPNRSNATSELEKQVSPGRGRTTATPDGGQKKTYTPKDIADFFNEVRDGKFKGKEEQRNKIESDIFAAQAEGRIVHV